MLVFSHFDRFKDVFPNRRGRVPIDRLKRVISASDPEYRSIEAVQNFTDVIAASLRVDQRNIFADALKADRKQVGPRMIELFFKLNLAEVQNLNRRRDLDRVLNALVRAVTDGNELFILEGGHLKRELLVIFAFGVQLNTILLNRDVAGRTQFLCNKDLLVFLLSLVICITLLDVFLFINSRRDVPHADAKVEELLDFSLFRLTFLVQVHVFQLNFLDLSHELFFSQQLLKVFDFVLH